MSYTFGDSKSSSEPLISDPATAEEAISESGTYSYAIIKIFLIIIARN